MIVKDLLAEDTLQLRLHTPSSPTRLSRRISWCAPSEILDPTPLLTPNALLLTNGIGLNIKDERTWDAYVERLARVPVAAIAFGTGTAHRLLPAGLVKAAAAHDVPLLEIPRAVPFLQVHRHVTNVLQAERFAAVGRSWELAESCARLAASGAPLRRILSEVAKDVGPVMILDSAGTVIARSPSASGLDLNNQDQLLETEDRTIPLPTGSKDSFRLVAGGESVDTSMATLLAPAASIIAVQLKSAIEASSRKQAQLETLLNQIADWRAVALTEFARTFRSTGLDAEQPTFVVVARISESLLSAAWRVRIMLQERFKQVRMIVRDGNLFALAQSPAEPDGVSGPVTAQSLLATFQSTAPEQPLVLKGPSESIDELRLNLYHARELVQSVQRPTLLPELSIHALIAASAGHGAQTGARKLLAPVLAYDSEQAGSLLQTLQVFLDNDCQPSKTSQSLFIHRNTLGLRLRKLESLLDLRLDTLEGQATALMALRIFRPPNPD